MGRNPLIWGPVLAVGVIMLLIGVPLAFAKGMNGFHGVTIFVLVFGIGTMATHYFEYRPHDNHFELRRLFSKNRNKYRDDFGSSKGQLLTVEGNRIVAVGMRTGERKRVARRIWADRAEWDRAVAVIQARNPTPKSPHSPQPDDIG